MNREVWPKCGHERTEENTKLKSSGRRRKDGTRAKIARCRRCYNAKRLEVWHRNNPPKPRTPRPVTWEVEIRVRRSGKFQYRESATGTSVIAALATATNQAVISAGFVWQCPRCGAMLDSSQEHCPCEVG